MQRHHQDTLILDPTDMQFLWPQAVGQKTKKWQLNQDKKKRNANTPGTRKQTQQKKSEISY